jgi:hypothetical protein
VIATYPPKAQFVPMIAARLMLILAMFALLVAPLSMSGGSAMAMSPAASTSSDQQSVGHATHCDEMSGEADGHAGGDSSQNDCQSDCALACSAITAAGGRIADRQVGAAIIETRLPVDTLHGVNPESADPPPRTA